MKENRDNPRYPVVTLVLYFGYKKRWDKATTLYESVNVPDLFKPFVSDVKINLYNMGMAAEDIAKVLNEALSKVQQWLGIASA